MEKFDTTLLAEAYPVEPVYCPCCKNSSQSSTMVHGICDKCGFFLVRIESNSNGHRPDPEREMEEVVHRIEQLITLSAENPDAEEADEKLNEARRRLPAFDFHHSYRRIKEIVLRTAGISKRNNRKSQECHKTIVANIRPLIDRIYKEKGM